PSIYPRSGGGLGWPGIGWPGRENGLLSEETGGPPPSSEVSVAVGNTQTEALASLVAAANHSPEEATLLEAFLLGALGEVEQPDGHVRIDARLHASSFGSLPGGEVMETVWEPPVSTPAQLPENPVVTGKSVFPHGSSSFDLVGVSEASAVSPALQAAAAAMAAPA